MPEKIETTVARLEERQEALSKVVYEIKDNHLAHLSDDVREVRDKVDNIAIKIATWSGALMFILWVMGKLVDYYM